jgi:hypothetical protein
VGEWAIASPFLIATLECRRAPGITGQDAGLDPVPGNISASADNRTLVLGTSLSRFICKYARCKFGDIENIWNANPKIELATRA